MSCVSCQSSAKDIKILQKRTCLPLSKSNEYVLHKKIRIYLISINFLSFSPPEKLNIFHDRQHLFIFSQEKLRILDNHQYLFLFSWQRVTPKEEESPAGLNTISVGFLCCGNTTQERTQQSRNTEHWKAEPHCLKRICVVERGKRRCCSEKNGCWCIGRR